MQIENLKIDTNTKVFFGENSSLKVLDILKKSSDSNALLICSESAIRRNEIKNLYEQISSVSDISLWLEVQQDPRILDIDNCLAKFYNYSFTHVIGIGGGSAMDQAKATAVCLSEKKNLIDIVLSGQEIKKRDNTLILIPTTSGTGSELSYGSILTDNTSGNKLGLRGVNVSSDFSLVDPLLTISLPKKETMVTGFDALTHAIETLISNKANQNIILRSQKSIKKILNNLPILSEDLRNEKARREMSYASMMMGLNLAQSSTCMPHRLQYPLGLFIKKSHGEGLAAIYKGWVPHIASQCPERLSLCFEALQRKNGATTLSKAKSFTKSIHELKKVIGLDINLSDLGVTEFMVKDLVDNVKGNLDDDPSYLGKSSIERVYRDSFS